MLSFYYFKNDIRTHNYKIQELNEQARRSHAAGILSTEELQRTLRVNAKSYSVGIPDCGADALRLSLCARNIKSKQIKNLNKKRIRFVKQF